MDAAAFSDVVVVGLVGVTEGSCGFKVRSMTRSIRSPRGGITSSMRGGSGDGISGDCRHGHLRDGLTLLGRIRRLTEDVGRGCGRVGTVCRATVKSRESQLRKLGGVLRRYRDVCSGVSSCVSDTGGTLTGVAIAVSRRTHSGVGRNIRGNMRRTCTSRHGGRVSRLRACGGRFLIDFGESLGSTTLRIMSRIEGSCGNVF